MRVLILSQYFWPENFQINELAETLQEKGVEVEILTGKPNYPKGKFYAGYRGGGCVEEFHHGLPIHRIPIVARGNGGLRLGINYFSFVLSGLFFAPWLLRKRKYDVVFVYAPSPILQAIPALFVGRVKKCPVLLWVQDLWPESLSATGYVRNNLILKIIEWVVRFIYRHCDLLLVQSRGFEAPVRKLACQTRVAYHPNSVESVFSNPSNIEVPEVEGLGEGFTLLFAGNIGSAQAVDVIIEVAEILKSYEDIHFVVVGDGSRRDEMILSCRRRGLKNVHLPGRFPVEMMPTFMKRASALIVTLADKPIFSLTVPNKVQAYLAVGKPIIACLNGEGARIVTEAEAGLTAPAEDAAALAAAIIRLYEMDEISRNIMGLNGRRYFETNFDHDRLVDVLITHFESEVTRKRERK
ncbi:MAG: glycosyltransferase family 4 protein [Verrucomicrobiales bacterium]|nr:glycosyltransferase family 4 protein [Verrucomicrobiales bacterium]